MYRVNYDKFIEILERGGCQVSLAELERRDLEPSEIAAIEINFDIDDEGTDDEILTVSEFNIYLTNDVVLFGTMLKHEPDFTIEWARTKPLPDFTILGHEKVEMPHVDERVTKALDYLGEKALDACEFADTSEEKHEGYTKCDKAYARVAEFIKATTGRMSLIQGKVGDLSRVIEKQCGNADGEDDEINKRIDEIYNMLNTKKGD